MHNFKHSMAAFLAVVLISSLAVAQAAEISSANAKKLDVQYNNDILNVSDTSNNGEADVVSIEEQASQEATELTPEELSAKKDTISFIGSSDTELIYNNASLEELRPFEPLTGYVITTTGGLNVRNAPSLDSQILDSITYGQMIDIIGEENEWYIIPHGENDGIGYVLKEYISTSYEEAKKILLESVMYESGVVNVEGGTLNVRSGAGTEGTLVIDQIADGDCIIVLDRVNDEWMKVYYGNNYSTGYVMSQYVHIGEMVARNKVAEDRIKRIDAISQDGVFVVSGSYVNCRQMPSENSISINTFANGDKCLIVDEGSEWTKIAYGPYRITGYVKSKYVMSQDDYNAMTASSRSAKKSSKKTVYTKSISNANPAPSSKGQAIVNAAAKYIGVRYVYGGSSPSGFDCSGLVQYACRQVGISVNRTSRAQYSNGVAVSKSNLQPGDLVFFSKGSGISHVGIYAGNGQVIHAPSPGKRVCYIALSKICSYSTYVGARRVY